MHPTRPPSEATINGPASKPQLYQALNAEIAGLFAGEPDAVANAANLCAVIYHGLPQLNWAGFYFLQNGELVLGPFQGKVACVRIALGRGVCGTAAQLRETLIVPNVHAFPGHIACDSASRSEIVVPLLKDSRVIGVLDLDSPVENRFDAQDGEGLRAAADLWLAHSRILG